MAFAAFMIAAHQSHVLLALALLAVLLPLRGTVALHSVAPLVLAVVALVSVNLLAFGRASLSPFGNVFLLARVIYDGPGADVLRRATVTPWIERDFPHSEAGAYAASRQSAGMLEVPAWMQALHLATALAGVAACVALLLPASRKRIQAILPPGSPPRPCWRCWPMRRSPAGCPDRTIATNPGSCGCRR